MGDSEKGQVSRSAAEIYEEFFLPALFAEWGPRVVAAAAVGSGDRVLDVACGTGVAARTAAGEVGPDGGVAGLDPNGGMLAVARRLAPEVDWHRGVAEAIPFDDGTFDAVTCQFGLMFFDDRVKSLSEMARVLRPGGRLAVAVWDRLDNTPGYAAMTALLDRLFGNDTGDALRAPYCLGDTNELRSLFDAAGIDGAVVSTHAGTARFPSIQSWVHTDVKGWTLADAIDDEQYARLAQEASREMQRFTGGDGTVTFAAPAHIVTATMP
jgi:SAM-dependent methyltransferase